MRVTFVPKLFQKPLDEILDRTYYTSYKFRYESYNIEKSIANDMKKVKQEDADFSGRAVAVLRRNAHSQVFRREVLEMIMLQIGTSLVQTNELMWTYKNDKSLHKHELEVVLHIPVKEKLLLEFEVIKPSPLNLEKITSFTNPFKPLTK